MIKKKLKMKQKKGKKKASIAYSRNPISHEMIKGIVFV
jgi:hypothetical protein